MNGFLISAPMSGHGKTTVSVGLMAALVRRGLTVQPFKCGPDYIDTKFHQRITGRESVNLDLFFADETHIQELYSHYGSNADVCVVEGMMGLFDGYSKDKGSAAQIARALNLPVVLVVDASHAAYSMAALLQGYTRFNAEIKVCGVIFNKVGSSRHELMLREVCEDTGVECLGCIPRRESLNVGSRYLGLDFSENHVDDLEQMEQWVDLDRLLSLCSSDSNYRLIRQSHHLQIYNSDHNLKNCHNRVVMACNDESFSFFYKETIDTFASVVRFNPETEVPQLDACDLLYLPGGYPERHAEALTRNKAARSAISEYAEQGGGIWAECGGMMYLCKEILTDEGSWAMCGVLPYTVSARTADRKLSLGYRQFEMDGNQYRGHEFHYSQFVGEVPQSAVQIYDAMGHAVPSPIIRYKNVWASYTHIYIKPTPSPFQKKG